MGNLESDRETSASEETFKIDFATDMLCPRKRLELISRSIEGLKIALAETAKIEISPRFYLSLKEVREGQLAGLVLALESELCPDRSVIELRILPNDKRKSAALVFSLGGDEILNAVRLTEAGELSRLPRALQSSVRIFLEAASELAAEIIKAIEGRERSGEGSGRAREARLAKKLLSESFFFDDNGHGQDNRAELAPDLEPLELA